MIIDGWVIKKEDNYYNSISPTGKHVMVSDPRYACLVSLQEDAKHIAADVNGEMYRARLIIESYPE